jgi:hypothetical protein
MPLTDQRFQNQFIASMLLHKYEAYCMTTNKMSGIWMASDSENV